MRRLLTQKKRSGPQGDVDLIRVEFGLNMICGAEEGLRRSASQTEGCV